VLESAKTPSAGVEDSAPADLRFPALVFLMHAFVAAVLLRLAWLDPFVPDAQSQPQHRELTQSCGCSTGEGTSVVSANRFRQSELAKGGFEYRPGVLAVGSLYGTTTQQVSTAGIRDRQRITA
jgi:hypothetical protein